MFDAVSTIYKDTCDSTAVWLLHTCEQQRFALEVDVVWLLDLVLLSPLEEAIHRYNAPALYASRFSELSYNRKGAIGQKPPQWQWTDSLKTSTITRMTQQQQQRLLGSILCTFHKTRGAV